MEVAQAITSRRSIRAYLPQPVSQEIIREILETALRTPSTNNTQPWEIAVLSGEVLDKIKRDHTALVTSGAPSRGKLIFSGIYRERQVEIAMDIFKLMGIQREDRERRLEWMLRGYRYFDAPAAIILFCDKSMRETTMADFDLGALAQTICLAAMSHGLGTCIGRQGVEYPEVLRKHTGISDDKDFVISIALGYPDPDFPANQLVSSRLPLDEVTTWLGF